MGILAFIFFLGTRSKSPRGCNICSDVKGRWYKLSDLMNFYKSGLIKDYRVLSEIPLGSTYYHDGEYIVDYCNPQPSETKLITHLNLSRCITDHCQLMLSDRQYKLFCG